MAASDDQREKNLQAILKWSLQQQGDGTRPSSGVQIDPERQQWLQEALDSMMAGPSETDMLKAAITVLKAHGESSAGEEDEVEILEKAFEEIQYLIEDLDHAKDLIPLDGVSIILQYLHHSNSSLLQSACEVVATATQNNPICQQVFLPSLPRLLTIVDDSSLPDTARVKALYAISCLTREYEPGLEELLRLEGLPALLHCLHSEVKKMVIKALFMIMSYYSTGSGTQVLLLQEKISTLVPELISILKSCQDDEILGHVLSVLNTLSSRHLQAVKECRKPEFRLQAVLQEKLKVLSQQKEERETIEDILRTCFHTTLQ